MSMVMDKYDGILVGIQFRINSKIKSVRIMSTPQAQQMQP
jgi:hypothetical protein